MKVIVIKRFKDLREGVVRESGDTFIISKERYREINLNDRLVEEVKQKPKSG